MDWLLEFKATSLFQHWEQILAMFAGSLMPKRMDHSWSNVEG